MKVSDFAKHNCSQAALEKDVEQNDISPADDSTDLSENVEFAASNMNKLSLSGNTSPVAPPSNSTDHSTSEDQVQEVDKKIRALKKKVLCFIPVISVLSCCSGAILLLLHLSF